MNRALLLIDFQNGFDDPFFGARSNPDAETNAARLLTHWRAIKQPIIHVRHISRKANTPLSYGQRGCEIKPIVAPLAGETLVEKSVNAAFIGTDLLSCLRGVSADTVVICGMSVPHCVSTTARMAANLGFAVELAEDASVTFEVDADLSWKPGSAKPDIQLIHDMAVAHLSGEFLTVRGCDDIIADPLE